MFSTLPKTNFKFSVKFILSAANAFNFDQSEILSFGKAVKTASITSVKVDVMYCGNTFKINEF